MPHAAPHAIPLDPEHRFCECLRYDCHRLPALRRARESIDVHQETLPRLDRDGNLVAKRPLSLKPEGVNYQDCLHDQKIRFPLMLSGFEANANLQVWAGLAGTDCAVQANRSGSHATCWQLTANVPLSGQTVVDIPVRSILAGAPPNTPATPKDDETVCGTVDLAQISVQFLYFSPGQLATPSATKAVSIEVDTIGPAPLTGLRTTRGDGHIVVEWDNIGGGGVVSAHTGATVYCELTAAAPEGDGEISKTCSSAHLLGGLVPDADFASKYECGSIAGDTVSSLAARTVGGQPLTNRTADTPNVTYALAVAVTDAFGNVGPLSTPICDYPEELPSGGGEDGRGGCSMSSAPSGRVWGLSVVGLSLVSALRRRRSAVLRRHGER
ncbi:MAG TPA: hypothetical protein VM580_23610 [Labilithrix sp.]|nr:hypothetical protein [Labilithrix sp.]